MLNLFAVLPAEDEASPSEGHLPNLLPAGGIACYHQARGNEVDEVGFPDDREERNIRLNAHAGENGPIGVPAEAHHWVSGDLATIMKNTGRHECFQHRRW